MSLVVHDRDGDVVHVRLNRPERHQALAPEMWHRAPRLGAELQDDGSIRCVVISGEGGSFSSGIDRRALALDGLTPSALTGYEADRERTTYDERDVAAAIGHRVLAPRRRLRVDRRGAWLCVRC